MDHSLRRPLKVGIMLPFGEYTMNTRTPSWTDLQTMALRAEELGYDSLWLGEHLLIRFSEARPELGGAITSGAWECWSLLAALAAATKRIELGPLVACTNFHNPAWLAKVVDTIEEISGGRLILGLGAGWNEPEFRAFGYPFDHRVSRFEEAFTIIRTLLREGHIDFEGQYYQARECELRPRGPRAAGPPILIGSSSPRMLGLAARHADLWNAAWEKNQPEQVRPLLAVVDAACQKAGRAPETLGRTLGILVNASGEEGGMDMGTVKGTPEVLAEILRKLAQEGISHVQIWFQPNTLANIEAFAPALELLDRR